MPNNFLHNQKILEENNLLNLNPKNVKSFKKKSVDINKLLNRIKIENKRKKTANIQFFVMSLSLVGLIASFLYF
jgi:hypothetical protein